MRQAVVGCNGVGALWVAVGVERCRAVQWVQRDGEGCDGVRCGGVHVMSCHIMDALHHPML